ncbi:amino acid--[acyl-carrier-protein] ligase [Mycobacterium sp. C31M]
MTLNETTPLDEAAHESLESARREFRLQLIEAELLIPLGVDGLYGRGGVFERIVDGIDFAVRTKGRQVHGDRPTVRRFPPVYPREVFERTDYIASFPNLTGALSTFVGADKEHRALLADREAGRSWDGHLQPAETMVVPAACHPGYATLPKSLPEGGALLDIYGYCFRHEPALDPARMQAFRMHEYVQIGTPQQAQEHRDAWVSHGLAVLAELGLTAEPAPANDPFFGRVGKMLSANQRDDELKTELIVRLYGDHDAGTAVASANLAREHFGEAFGITTADGGVAHSSCAAFGMERIALALLRTHGLDPTIWPAGVRTALSL